MTRRVDAVVFDLDDTLIDWWGSWTACVASFADDEVVMALAEHVRRYCWQVRPGTDGHVWHRNTWQVFEHRHDLWHAALGAQWGAAVDELIREFEQRLWVDFFDEVIPTLEALAVNHRLAVLSNNVHLPAEATRLGLSTWFEHCLVADSPAKPDAGAFLRACDHLGTRPDRTWYVGDSVRADALGALGAGLVPVWVDRFGDPWPDRPDTVHRVVDLSPLPELVG